MSYQDYGDEEDFRKDRKKDRRDRRNRKLARLDKEGTATGLTRIVHHPRGSELHGPGMSLTDPEFEDESGDRISLSFRK